MISKIFDNLWVIILVAVILVLILVMVSSMVHASPDKAKVISGLRKHPKFVIGASAFKIPFVERVDELCLSPIKVDVKTDPNNPIPTIDFIGVNIDSNFFIQIDPEQLDVAARNFLNMSEKEIADKLQDALQGNLREIVGKSTLEQLSKDRKALGDLVQETATQDMQKLGIKIMTSNIQSLTDENNLMESLGAENTSKIKKDAMIAKANAEKEIKIAQAEARKDANKAESEAQLAIEKQNIERDREIEQQKNQLEKERLALKEERDVAQAKADSVYSIEEAKHKKTLISEEQAAKLEEANKQAELNKQAIILKEQTLEADIKKQADAELYKRQKDAEAKLIEEQNEAEARKAKAEAEYVEAQRKADAENYEQLKQAEAVKAKGLAEAEAIRAKGDAEAESIQKIAEAKKLYGEKQMEEKELELKLALINNLPAMAGEIAKSVSQIDTMTVYGGTSDVSGMVPAIMKQVLDTTLSATGIDISDIAMSNSKSAKTDKTIDFTNTVKEG